MSNANKIARYITTIYSAPSYAANVFVVKPNTVAATFFFFFHITDVLSLTNTSTFQICMSYMFHKSFYTP